MEELEKWIMEELNEEWWSDGHIAFIDSGKKMLDAGLPIDKVKEIFSDLYSAVSNEYGD